MDSHLMNIINNDLSNNSFSNEAKVATVRPIYKKKSRDKIENYRPVSILSCFSKVYEKFLLEKFKPFINTFLSKFIAAYRENYSSSHVLIRLIENWKQALDENFVVGTVLIDLCKAFDCIPHDLLIAKLYAYGFSEKSAVFLYSYLKRRKQNVKIDNILSTFQSLISGVPKGSILGPILFNIFLNDLLTTLEIDGNKIETAKSVDLLGIHIDNKVTFDIHIFTLCNKASLQLNAIGRLKHYLGKKELQVIIKSFIYSNFNFCPLVWHFSSCKALQKNRKY